MHLHFQIRGHDQDELVAVYLQSHAIDAVNQRKVSALHLLCITRKANTEWRLANGEWQVKVGKQSLSDT